jgi:phosphoenolpyruvate synthase/pyruvate phosphate dikinase
LKGALHENLIKPKGDAEVVNKLAEDIAPLSSKMNELDVTIRCLKDAEKDELQVGMSKIPCIGRM